MSAAPGSAPFRRGGRGSSGEQPWTVEIIVGAGDPEDTARLAREALDAGADRIALRLDRTVHGLTDPDPSESRDGAGETGMMACRAADLANLLREVDPGRLVVLADRAAAPVAACVIAGARSLGRDWRGFGISNDPLGEALATGSAPEEWALRACRDLSLWLAAEAPQATRQILGAGVESSTAGPAAEIAALLSHAASYRQLGFGGTVQARLACGHRIFEEAAKFRAAREAYFRTFGGPALEITAVSRLDSLTAPQSDVNLVRLSLQAMAAALGGATTVSLLPCEMDRAWVRLAVRTQQVLAAETGVTRVADPAGGAAVVEQKTTEIAAQALDLAALDLARVWEAVRQGDTRFRPVVGVTRFGGAPMPGRVKPHASQGWFEGLALDRARRDPQALDQSLGRLRDAARSAGNLMPRLIEAAERQATLGELFDGLRDCR